MSAFFLYVTTNLFTLSLLGLALVLALFVIFAIEKSQWILYFFLIWFPLENVILRWLPIEYYAPVKYLPEVLIYATVLFSWYRFIRSQKMLLPHLPVNRWIMIFLGVAVISLLTNWYSATTWFLGLRQLLRFVFIFFIVLFENYSPAVMKRFLVIGAVMIFLESFLGVVQYVAGGALDTYLFFSDTVTIGAVQLEGNSQFWAPGQRVFATFGRYDRLGSFIALGLVMAFPWLSMLNNVKHKMWAGAAFGVGLLALVLTYSRASWLACVVGIFVIAYFLHHDFRFIKRGAIAAFALGAYLFFVIVFQNYAGGVLDRSSQTLTQRLVEAVSPYSWQQNYEGFGRFFFIVNTPLVVVRSAPFFGVGPGNYGGGVAAALGNTKVYDILHLPFGIQNTFGQIDNNWLSIWAEFGTLGLLAWIFILAAVIQSARKVAEHSKNLTQRFLAEGVIGIVASMMVLAYFGPYFEFRTLMLYFWLLVGMALHYYRAEYHAWNFLKE